MIRNLSGTTQLYLALKQVGFVIPNECGDIVLIMPVDGPVTIRYTVFVMDEELKKLGEALRLIAAGEVQAAYSNRELRAGLDAALKTDKPLDGAL